MADHLAVMTGRTRGFTVANALGAALRVDARGHGRLGNPLAGRPARFATAWSLHLADSRGRVGPAAALGPEGGRRAPLTRPVKHRPYIQFWRNWVASGAGAPAVALHGIVRRCMRRRYTTGTPGGPGQRPGQPRRPS
jgi:hypothetical protein